MALLEYFGENPASFWFAIGALALVVELVVLGMSTIVLFLAGLIAHNRPAHLPRGGTGRLVNWVRRDGCAVIYLGRLTLETAQAISGGGTSSLWSELGLCRL